MSETNPVTAENKNLLLKHMLSPGDVLVLTAAVESLMKQYPNQYRVLVETTCSEIWQNNPHIGNCQKKDCQTIQMHYPNIHKSHMIGTGHFMKAFCDYLGEQLKIPLILQVNKPHLYLSAEEQKDRLISCDYIVVNAGVKMDYTCKGWGHNNYQEVVDLLRDKKFNIVQIGEKHHRHKPLRGVINLLGKTKPRELFSLCYHSQGGIGGVTFLQHIMASLEKPYVCLLGGREPATWIWYPSQTILSTQGQLPCCKPNACWKSRVVPLKDGDSKDQSLCKMPVNKNGEMIPKCMEMISPYEVVNALLKYVEGGIIPLSLPMSS
jgi:ADP-heptose:LPS heptosyltransferase